MNKYVLATGPAYFAELWLERTNPLGCPTGSARSQLIEQTFAGGLMFWRDDPATIYVLPAQQPYTQFADTWDDRQPIYSCSNLFPAHTPPTPQRGFGKVWCQEPLVRKLLGQAIQAERPFEATLQEFEHGLMFQTDTNVIYILEDQAKGWERLEE